MPIADSLAESSLHSFDSDAENDPHCLVTAHHAGDGLSLCSTTRSAAAAMQHAARESWPLHAFDPDVAAQSPSATADTPTEHHFSFATAAAAKPGHSTPASILAACEQPGTVRTLAYVAALDTATTGFQGTPTGTPCVGSRAHSATSPASNIQTPSLGRMVTGPYRSLVEEIERHLSSCTRTPAHLLRSPEQQQPAALDTTPTLPHDIAPLRGMLGADSSTASPAAAGLPTDTAIREAQPARVGQLQATLSSLQQMLPVQRTPLADITRLVVPSDAGCSGAESPRRFSSVRRNLLASESSLQRSSHIAKPEVEFASTRHSTQHSQGNRLASNRASTTLRFHDLDSSSESEELDSIRHIMHSKLPVDGSAQPLEGSDSLASMHSAATQLFWYSNELAEEVEAAEHAAAAEHAEHQLSSPAEEASEDRASQPAGRMHRFDASKTGVWLGPTLPADSDADHDAGTPGSGSELNDQTTHRRSAQSSAHQSHHHGMKQVTPLGAQSSMQMQRISTTSTPHAQGGFAPKPGHATATPLTTLTPQLGRLFRAEAAFSEAATPAGVGDDTPVPGALSERQLNHFRPSPPQHQGPQLPSTPASVLKPAPPRRQPTIKASGKRERRMSNLGKGVRNVSQMQEHMAALNGDLDGLSSDLEDGLLSAEKQLQAIANELAAKQSAYSIINEALSDGAKQPSSRSPVTPRAIEDALKLELAASQEDVLQLQRQLQALSAAKLELELRLQTLQKQLAQKDEALAAAVQHAQHAQQRLADSDTTLKAQAVNEADLLARVAELASQLEVSCNNAEAKVSAMQSAHLQVSAELAAKTTELERTKADLQRAGRLLEAANTAQLLQASARSPPQHSIAQQASAAAACTPTTVALLNAANTGLLLQATAHSAQRGMAAGACSPASAACADGQPQHLFFAAGSCHEPASAASTASMTGAAVMANKSPVLNAAHVGSIAHATAVTAHEPRSAHGAESRAPNVSPSRSSSASPGDMTPAATPEVQRSAGACMSSPSSTFTPSAFRLPASPAMGLVDSPASTVMHGATHVLRTPSFSGGYKHAASALLSSPPIMYGSPNPALANALASIKEREHAAVSGASLRTAGHSPRPSPLQDVLQRLHAQERAAVTAGA